MIVKPDLHVCFHMLVRGEGEGESDVVIGDGDQFGTLQSVDGQGVKVETERGHNESVQMAIGYAASGKLAGRNEFEKG